MNAVTPSFREGLEFRAAQLYYERDRTMEAISRELGVSRATVSRLLQEARNRGIVRVSVHPPTDRSRALEHRLHEMYGVRALVAEPPRRRDPAVTTASVAALAAQALDELITPGAVIGTCWGNTMTAVAERLPHREVEDLTVVGLNGAIHPDPLGTRERGGYRTAAEEIAAAYSGAAELLPVPPFFDHASTKAAMWQERTIRRMLDLQRRCTAAIFGIGTFHSSPVSQVYAQGYLNREDLNGLTAEGVVGDVCTVFFRGDGSWRDVELNRRSTGMLPDELRRIPHRIGVVNGPHKVTAVRGALAASLVSVLVLDRDSANELVHGL
ncbi:sugar-binding transcriptional regulator [Nesterenkonia alba]|uniref:sugar-binding transcriptional regulator n=1 Tax=Nesterenkonia alba TaxID=515814 RepID=UPI000687E3FB|nr:sugar-binding domain-containing protein [Nesterenkonia alba]